MPYRRSKQQARAALGLALVVLSLTLAGCGKKPSQLDPPPDVTEDHFPLSYPDPATDPKP